jgi:tetratricopeptide (TPR) repeat protein
MGDGDVWNMRRGVALLRAGRPEEATSSLDRVRPSRLSLAWTLDLAALYQRVDALRSAESVYRTAISVSPDDPRAHRHLAHLLETERDWEMAAEVHREALSRGVDPNHHASRLGWNLERLGDETGAEHAYRLAARDRVGSSASLWALRRLAALLAATGRWLEAADCARRVVAEEPEDGASHRLAGRAAAEAWRWGFTLERHADGTGSRDVAVRMLDEAERTPLLEFSVEAYEAAVKLKARPAWMAALGSAYASAGHTDRAAEMLQRATRSGASSESAWVLRQVPRWDFERAQICHRRGERSPEETLLACGVVPDMQARRIHDPALGFFEARVIHAGLQIEGVIPNVETDRVRIMLDGHLLREQTVSGTGELRRFSFFVQESTLHEFPRDAHLEVRSAEDAPLAVAPASVRPHVRRLALHVPHGNGRIIASLEEGRTADKKGGFAPSLEEVRERQDAYLRLYRRVSAHFDQRVGAPLFVMYGTLLGLHRDADLIPGDDDFDAGWLSEALGPEQAKAESLDVMRGLLKAGFRIGFNARGRLFRVSDALGDPEIHLDVRPLWFESGRVWAHNHLSYPSTHERWTPVARRSLRGVQVYVPRDPEDFLRAYYGPGWAVPDPGFANHPEDVPSQVRERLDRALLSPREYRQWRASIKEAMPDVLDRLVTPWDDVGPTPPR